MKGLVHTTKSMPRESMNGWDAHVDLDIGSNLDQQMDSGGFALYYPSNVEISTRKYGLYGYSSRIYGVAVVLSTFIK